MSPDVLRQVMEEMIPFNRFLGVRVAELRKGHARLEIPFRDELIGDPLRPALHGGVLSMLADERARLSTIDLRIDYLRPARLDTIIAEATVVRLGNRVGVADVRLFQPGNESETVATGKGVYNVMIKKEKLE